MCKSINSSMGSSAKVGAHRCRCPSTIDGSTAYQRPQAKAARFISIAAPLRRIACSIAVYRPATIQAEQQNRPTSCWRQCRHQPTLQPDHSLAPSSHAPMKQLPLGVPSAGQIAASRLGLWQSEVAARALYLQQPVRLQRSKHAVFRPLFPQQIAGNQQSCALADFTRMMTNFFRANGQVAGHSTVFLAQSGLIQA